MFKAGADVMAQHMYQEPGDNCYDKEIGWYRSPLSNCKYPAVSVRGGGGSSFEFVQGGDDNIDTDLPDIDLDFASVEVLKIPKEGVKIISISEELEGPEYRAVIRRVSKKEAAKKELEEWYNRVKGMSFSLKYHYFSATKIYNRIKELIDNPASLDQGITGTCGAAVIIKLWLENDPVKFVKAATSLCENGYYYMNDDYKLKVDPDSFDAQGGSLKDLDIIVLGALCHTWNYVFSYNGFEDGIGPRSAGNPIKMLEFLDILGVKYETNYLPNRKEIEVLLKKGKFVIALASFDKIKEGEKENIGKYDTNLWPAHYAQIVGLEGDRGLRFWSWGVTPQPENKNKGYYVTTDCSLDMIISVEQLSKETIIFDLEITK